MLILCLDGHHDVVVRGHDPSDQLPPAATGPEGGGDVEGLPTARAEAEAEVSETSAAGGDSALHHPPQAQQQLCGLHAVAEGWPPGR